MTAWLRVSVARNLGLWLVGAMMLALAVVFALAYRAFRREAAVQVLERDEQVAILSAARLRSDLEDFAEILRAVARPRDLSTGSLAEQGDMLQAAAPRLSVFDGGVVLLNDRGLVRAALPQGSGLVGEDWSDRDLFRGVLGDSGMYVSDAQAISAREDLIIAVAVPIRGEADQLEGALVGMFRLGEPTQSALYAAIVRLRLGQAGPISIIDGRGRIIFDTDPARVGHFLSSEELPLIANPSVAVAELTEDSAGEEVVLAHAPVPVSNWTLVTQSDWATVTQSTRRYRDILFLAFGAALLLPPLSLALITRQRRFRFLSATRPEQDEGWVRVARDYLHPRQWPVLPGWSLFGRGSAGKRSEYEFVDAALLPDGRLMLSLGLVRARGIRAVLAISSTRTVLRACAQRLSPPDDALQQCSLSLCLQFDHPVEVHATVVHLDPRSGWLDYACAGTSPLEVEGKRVLQVPASAGEPMGISPSATFEVGRVRMEPGSLLLLLGPSMTGARNDLGQTFLPPRLTQILEEDRLGLEDLTERIFRAFKQFNARSPLFEPDLTAIVLERSDPETVS